MHVRVPEIKLGPLRSLIGGLGLVYGLNAGIVSQPAIRQRYTVGAGDPGRNMLGLNDLGVRKELFFFSPAQARRR